MTQQFISESCAWFHRQQNYGEALVIESLSGLGINKLGDYEQCIKQPSLHYFLIEYGLLKLQSKLYTGICYSKNCSSSDLRYIMRSLNQSIPLPFEIFRILQPYQEIKNWNQYQVALMIILSAILLLNIIGTILNCCESKLPSKLKNFAHIFSIKSSFQFLFGQSKNHERIKIIGGLRAFAFFGMTMFNLSFLLIQAPTIPQPAKFIKSFKALYFFNDLWLLISGFYLSFELYKNWVKDQSTKSIGLTFVRKCSKIIVISCLSILGSNWLVERRNMNGTYETIIKSYFDRECHLFNVFGQCNYWLWIWQIQIEMSLITSLLFIVKNSKIKHSRAFFYSLNILFLFLSFISVAIFEPHPEPNYTQGQLTRCPLVSGLPYLIGFNLGIFYFFFKTHRNKSKMMPIKILRYKANRILGCILSLTLLALAQLYYLYQDDQNTSIWKRLLVQTFHITIPLSFSLLVLAQMVGYESTIGTLLKDRFLNVISRLSFVGYTIYYGICIFMMQSLKQDIYLNGAKLLNIWVSSIMISLGVGLVISVTIQMPIYRILQIKLGKQSLKSYIQFY